ncbi:ribonuclease J [Candidatus Collierbacteria bacterium]|nr:ribonuclease J [Candidatus Collierbacteria bacterium]
MVNNHTLKLISLGGIGDVTKNMYIYEYADSQIAVDCGIGFPKETALGVDVVIPDISYLEKSGKKLLGIILTHGHQDHIGGLPYILPRLPQTPVFGSILAVALAENKVREFGLPNQFSAVKDHLSLGPFEIDFIHITHSIPDCKHLLIKTPAGTVYHGADFKFDLTPMDNLPADFNAIAKAGVSGIDVLLTDSLRVEQPGFTPSERSLLSAIDQAVRNTAGKFIFTTISSAISRIDMAIQAAVKYNRKVALAGRSIENNVKIAAKHGFIKIPKDALIDVRNVSHYKPHQIAIIIAGAAGQEGSAMHRLAAGEHQILSLKPKDHVVISADAIPGTESDVYSLIDTLYKQGALVSYSGTTQGLHVSGHGYRGDLALLVRMTRPKHIVPIGGNIRHMYAYRQMVQEMAYQPNQVHLLEGGQVLSIDHQHVRTTGVVETKNVYVDGLGIGDVGSIVLRDRQVMAADGMLLAIVPVRRDNSQVAGDVEIVSRGFVYMKESADLIEKAKKHVRTCLKNQKGIVTDWGFIRKKIERALERFLYEATQRRPLILCVVLEV